MAVPNNKSWSARFEKGEIKVDGEVQVSGSNYEPKLTRREPQGINPSILILDLTIERTAEVGDRAMAFKAVDYKEMAGMDDYKTVSVMWDMIEDVVDIPVESD